MEITIPDIEYKATKRGPRLTLKNRMFLKTLVEGKGKVTQTDAYLRAYNAKRGKTATNAAYDVMSKPIVKQAFIEMLDRAGLSESALADKWNEAVSMGWGVKATHKHALDALTKVSKMRGLMDNKSAHLRINVNKVAENASYPELLKKYKELKDLSDHLVNEGETVTSQASSS